MPYPNFHACRIAQPISGADTRYDKGARNHGGKSYDVIYQRGSNGKMHEQAYRYPKGSWSADSARSH